MTNLGKILAKEAHKTFGNILAGDDYNTTARPLPRTSVTSKVRPAPATVSPPLPMQLPAHQLGRHLRVNRRLLGQISNAYVVACKSS